MRIDHMIIGCRNVLASQKFYNRYFNFKLFEEFVDTGTGNKGMIMNSQDPDYDLKILLVPFPEVRLPSPQHIAFSLKEDVFKQIYTTAKTDGLKIRSQPPMDCTEYGIGSMDFQGKSYNIFYIADPSNVNLECMTEKRNKLI